MKVSGKRRSLVPRCMVLAASLAALALFLAPAAQAAFGVTQFSNDVEAEGGGPYLQASGHPFAVTTKASFTTTTGSFGEIPDESVRKMVVELPAGFVGSTTTLPRCTVAELAETVDPRCSFNTQVGVLELKDTLTNSSPVPLYNMDPPPGVPASFGANVFGVPVYLNARIRSGSDYGVTIESANINQTLTIYGLTVTLWGVPGDPAHDNQRCRRLDEFGTPHGYCNGVEPKEQPNPMTVPIKPLLTNTSECSGIPFTSWMRSESWAGSIGPVLASTLTESGAPAAVRGCDQVPFQPTMTVRPESHVAGAPTGLETTISIPGGGLESPNGIAQSALKDVSLQLPPGMTLSAAAAGGLVGCSEADFKLGTAFPASCPEASKLGTVEVQTPLLATPLSGSVYLASQEANPFKSLVALYVSVADPKTGVVLKLPGKVSPDPRTGQLTVHFANLPQLPFTQFSLDFSGGSRAALVNPPACGTYRANAELAGWSNPGEPVSSPSTFTIDQACGQAAGFTPGFSAGTTDPVAGGYSPFVLRVTRPDGQQNVQTIAAALPKGLLAKLAGVPLCGDAGAATGNCPAASQVGSATVGAGAGTTPIYVPEANKAPTAVYLAGPYKGAQYSLVVKVPAQAGPFDLGTVAVRNALHIDPETTQVTAISDALPQILRGIPIAYRDIRIELNRPQFTVNPTSCDATRVTGTIGSAGGASANVADRFQVADCASLGFKPRISLRLHGAPPRRGGNPALRATVTPAKGDANIGKARVILPATELLEQGHIRTVCTRVQFAASQCPAGSIYGHAKAWTPLLDRPLEGPVYLRSNGGERKLPDLVADLNGSIHVVLVGYIDSVKRHGAPRIRTRFLTVPDAPVSRFVLDMRRGRKSLLSNTTNLCKAKPRAEASLVGQNGKGHESRPRVKVSGCGGKAQKKSKGHKRGK